MINEIDGDAYALTASKVPAMPAPELDYLPPKPKLYRPRIGLIGAGGISASHLDAYREAGWEVAAICNRTLTKATARAAEYFPQAWTTDNPSEILNDNNIDVVDITLHPADRLPLMEAALNAGKHVLSQKPFVLDLDDGERLVELANANNLKLAVNQNGRWAPHLAWMREAVSVGLIGDLISCHANIHWDHSWIAGTPYEEIEDLILYDFGIHWFDFVSSVVGDRAHSIFASAVQTSNQTAKVPLMAQAFILLDGGQASLTFDGAVKHGARDTTYIAGTKGSLKSDGPDLGAQSVKLTRVGGCATPDLKGKWFNDGFTGAMGALLVAIENNSEPANSARNNLRSLAMVFAAIESRRTGKIISIGKVRKPKI